MKNIITLFTLLLLIGTVQGQDKMFGDSYIDIRQQSTEVDEMFIFKKFSNKEIKEYVDALASDNNHTDEERVASERVQEFYERAKKVIFVMDGDSENFLSAPQLENLWQPYEELSSMKDGEMTMEVRGLMAKDKIKELVVLLQMKDGITFFIDLSFKKPIELGDFLENPANLSQFIRPNALKGKTSNAPIQFNYSKEEKFVSPSKISAMYESYFFRLDVVEEGGLYGVKMFMDDWEDDIIKPQFRKKMVLYGTNPGNTYIKVLENESDNAVLYDRFGLVISHGIEITPIYRTNSEEVAFFILKQRDEYVLYECPQKYALVKGDNYSLRSPMAYRLTGCQSITLKDESILECIKADGTVELIAI